MNFNAKSQCFAFFSLFKKRRHKLLAVVHFPVLVFRGAPFESGSVDDGTRCVGSFGLMDELNFSSGFNDSICFV
jgi:hypothetical protein